MNAIQIVDLTKQYKEVTAVDGLNLTVGEGELFSLLGVNGAGKTTTIKMLCCLTQPTSGEAFLCGESILQSPERVKEIIGVSPQETAVAANLTVRENLELMGGVHGFPKEKTAAKIQELSQQLKLGEVLSRRAGKMAASLLHSPRILFLDEPTLGLDVLARSDLWDTIRALKGRMTIVLTTHYMEEAEELSDRVGVMRDGHLLALGTPAELKAQAGKEKFEDAFVAIVRGKAQ